MIANDIADFYVSRKPGEAFADIARPIESWLRNLGWSGRIREATGATPGFLPLEPDLLGLVFDPVPLSNFFKEAISNARGQGRQVRVPFFDPLTDTWHLLGSEYGYAQRGLTLHGVMDTHLPMSGSFFALLPWQVQPTSLYFGSPATFFELIRHQTLQDRGYALICERIEFARKEGNAKGHALRGPKDIADSRPGSVIVLLAGRGEVRVVPGAFHDLAAAKTALNSSAELDIALFARIAGREIMG